MSGLSIENIPTLPPDALFGLKARYTQDDRPNKVDLGIGAYRDNTGKPWILPLVRSLEKLLQQDPNYNHEYLSISGFAEFTKSASKIILGDNSTAFSEERIISVQSLSGTGALHIAAVFLKKFYSLSNTIYLSSPTWANHGQIFQSAGLQIESYPYWNNETKTLDLEGFLSSINAAPNGSIFLLHACAHNPTGLDPSKKEWVQILDAIKLKNHFALFDSAYQGFTTGSLEEDAWAVRKLVDEYKLPMLVCQSFAKNCGMYGERVGCIHIILSERDAKLNALILSQLNKIVRSELSNPPAYGAKVVAKILNTPHLKEQWSQDLLTMSSRITSMRHRLRDELVALKTPGNWDHIVSQKGMFSFTGLKPEEVQKLESKHGVYLVSSGRASIAGLNEGNVKYVAQAIDDVVRDQSKL